MNNPAFDLFVSPALRNLKVISWNSEDAVMIMTPPASNKFITIHRRRYPRSPPWSNTYPNIL